MATKTNLELKHFCSDFGVIRKILRDIGAKKDVVKKQKDHFFFLPRGKDKVQSRLKLRIEGRAKTLVYYQRPDFQAGKSTTADIMLYDVHDVGLLPFLQRALGEQAIVEKKREVWRKGNTVFHLDEVNGVGKIFEVELQKKGNITKKDKAIFRQYQNRFKPFLGRVIKGSNVDLVRNL